jgi:transcriptional regulator
MLLPRAAHPRKPGAPRAPSAADSIGLGLMRRYDGGGCLPEPSMYEPLPHRQDDLAAQHALIRSHPLGLLISHGAEGLEANAIPFLVDPSASRLGTLQAHMARKQETGRVVPTWNYVMVQARGRPKVIEDAAWLRAQIEALTNRQEGARPAPWAVGDAPEAFIEMQVKAIVGLEVEIAHIAGKWKASQNRPAADRAGVIAGLEDIGDEAAATMASIVREAAPKT